MTTHRPPDLTAAAEPRDPARTFNRRFVIAAFTLAAGCVAWEYGLYLALDRIESSSAAILLHALLDFALLAPVALVVLAVGRKLACVLARDRSTFSRLCVGLAGALSVSLLLLTALALHRGAAHDALEARIERAAATGDGEVKAAAPALCSYTTLRATLGGATSTDDGTWTPSVERLRATLREALLVQTAVVPLAFFALLLLDGAPRRRASYLLICRRWVGHAIQRRPWLVPALACVAVVAAIATVGRLTAVADPTMSAMVLAPPNPCDGGAPTRTYNVSAIRMTMTLNRFGDHDTGAFMYVLDSRIPEVRAQEATPLPDRVSHGLRKDPIQPLILRANLGDCVMINFTNRLGAGGGPASLHVLGLPHTIVDHGGHVGLNPDSFANPGETITYKIPLPSDPAAEKAYLFHDHGAGRQRVAHGLFGALVAEPQGAEYLDPETGAPLTLNNWEAIIRVPGGQSFREFVIIYHEVGDESFRDIFDAAGNRLPQQDEGVSDIYRPASRALNYRSEPFRNRLLLRQEKSLGYSSYTFGDPSTPIPRSYLGEPTKTRLLHGGTEVFHVHHLHGGADRWRRNPKADDGNDISSGLNKLPFQNAFSIHLDSQSIGPGTSYNLEHECGAGGCQQAAGDFLYHCHIGHHYLAGMWAFWRVFDTQQPDLAIVPDLFTQGNNVTIPPPPVPAFGLCDTLFEDKIVRCNCPVADPATEICIDDWIAAQLPPPGSRLDADDATVWDWVRVDTPDGPRFFGEPETTATWPNYASPTPGERREILFNPKNGRYAWPLFTPHLGQRPPFAGNGHSGAPWLGERGSSTRADGLCPTASVIPGRQIRSYPISAIRLPIQVTETDVDPNGQIYVLNEDRDAVLAGTKPAEPLAIRSNVGDCVDIILTNEIPDGGTTIPRNFSKVNMHTHFVQFDPQASDGVITGLSYEQSVRPYANENRFLTADTAAGAVQITVTNGNRLRPGIWIGVGLGEGVCDPTPGIPDDQPVACTEVRKIEAINGTTITLDEPLMFAHSSGEAVGVEFVRYNWYSDVDFGTVFWHTHVDFKQWDHGLFGAHIVEPKGALYRDPTTGAEIRAGTHADIIVPDNVCYGLSGQQCGSFRELMLFIHTNLAFFGGNDAGGGTFNLRAAPFANRPGDPAFVFSSVLHGDPLTPILRAYAGDPVVIRLLGLIQRVSTFRVPGHRFRTERFADTGALSDGTYIGISERFDLVLDGGAGGPLAMPGDYLYYNGIQRQFENGAWGLIRVHDTAQPDLLALPNRNPPSGEGFPSLTFTGQAPPPAAGPGNPCPSGADVRDYDIRITNSEIVYNDTASPLLFFSRDPAGTVYMLDDGTPAPAEVREPLVLRVNAGECLRIDLHNETAARAGMSAGELLFDPQRSYGAAIGFNPDSSVAPGATRRYVFYADQELGTTLFVNLANPSTWARGAYGAIVVEPADASAYLDPDTGTPIESGVEADIVTPQGTFREFVALLADEDARIGQSEMPYPDQVEGFSAISYSAEPLEARGAGTNDDLVFDTDTNGDPRWVVEVPVGQPMTFRVAVPSGEQPHVFAVEGHRFPLEPDMVGSEQMFSRIAGPGMAFDAPLIGGAGGDFQKVGDNLFFDRRMPFLEAGMWGILRTVGDGTCGRFNESCDDGNACTMDACDAQTGVCTHTPIACGDDGDICTQDFCDPLQGCVHPPVDCNDFDACTLDSCDSAAGCVHAPINCNDGNLCTNDGCNTSSGCVHTFNTNPCDDGNACTTDDTCSNGACLGGPPPTCDDGNVCTDDSCDPATGCVNTPNTIACDDGDACTENDVCSNGICAGTQIPPGCGNGCVEAGETCGEPGAPACAFGDFCEETSCTCVTQDCVFISIGGTATLPPAGQPLSVDLQLDVGAMPLGSWSVDFAWNAAAFQLDAVVGGDAPFDGSPVCTIDNAAGTASCTSSQTGSSPVGALRVAELQFTVIDDSSANEIITALPVEFLETDGTAIPSCDPQDTLTLTGRCGDVNASGAVSVTDALLVAQLQVGLRNCTTIKHFSMCDISPNTPDGRCSIGDALRMAQCSVGLISCDFDCDPLVCTAP